MSIGQGVTAPTAKTPPSEIIDCKQLAKRWSVPENWIREHVRPRSARNGKPVIPHVRLGRYIRFEWGSPQLEQWFAEHRSRQTSRGSNRW